MPRAQRTINPLHFEDLEPHRFEDLVRDPAAQMRDILAFLKLAPDGHIADAAFQGRGCAISMASASECPQPKSWITPPLRTASASRSAARSLLSCWPRPTRSTASATLVR